MFFWSRRKSFGRLAHVTSRAAGDLLSSVGGRDDCWLSGNPPPVVCAQAIIGAQEMLIKKTRVNNDCFDAWLIEFLDAVLWSGYATCGPSFQADMARPLAVSAGHADGWAMRNRVPAWFAITAAALLVK